MAARGDVRAVPEADMPDVGAIVASAGIKFVKRHKVLTSTYVIGMIAALGFGGFAVDQLTAQEYQDTMEHADHVTGGELREAVQKFQQADGAYYNAKGWFWSCDSNCQQKKSKRDVAEERVKMVQQKRDAIVSEARQKVGVWSVYSVKDVRDCFWRAWENGKNMAKRWTMYDAMFLAFSGSRREEGQLAEFFIKLFIQFLSNLTIGLCGATVYFCYEVYNLVTTYGPSAISGTLFFLLACCAGIAMTTTILGGIFGSVGGGLYFMAKNAEKQRRLNGGQPGYQQHQRMQYRAAHSHYD
jgi:hypothetical protein